LQEQHRVFEIARVVGLVDEPDTRCSATLDLVLALSLAAQEQPWA
jgi:hypothetical protein